MDAVIDGCLWVAAGRAQRAISESGDFGGLAGLAGAGMAAGIVAGTCVAPQSVEQAPEFAGEVAATPAAVAEGIGGVVAAADAEVGAASAVGRDKGPPSPPGLSGRAGEAGRGAPIKGTGSFSRAIRREPAPAKAF